MRNKIICFIIVTTLFMMSCELTYGIGENDVSGNSDFSVEALDSNDDNPAAGLPSVDDFESSDEYYEYLDNNYSKDTRNEVLRSLSPNTTVEAPATFKYKIVLPSNDTRAIQNFFVGGTYVYITQCSGTTATISRCTVNESTKTISVLNSMTLQNFGHNQILEGFSRNNKLYFWVGCKPNTLHNNLSLQVGRVQYQPGVTITNYTKIPRFADLQYANTTSTSFGTMDRVDAGLSSNKTKLVIAARNTAGDIQYSIYDTETLNTLLDAKENQTSKYVSFNGNTTLQNACQFSCVQTVGNTALPNGSCQGIDLTNADSVYIAGGVGGSNNYHPQIGKLIKSNGTYIYSSLAILTNQNFGSKSEIEGVHIEGNELYFAIMAYGSNTRNNVQYLYSIDKTLL